jgi:hypothetical protein
MQGKFQEILDKTGMIPNSEASNESTFIQETTEGYVKTHLELLPDGRVKVLLESVLPLFEESSEKISSRLIKAQQCLLTD